MNDIRRVNKSFYKLSNSRRILTSLCSSFSMFEASGSRRKLDIQSFPPRLRHLTDLKITTDDDDMPDLSTLKYLQSIDFRTEINEYSEMNITKFPTWLKSIALAQFEDPNSDDTPTLYNSFFNDIIKRCPSIESIEYYYCDYEKALYRYNFGFQPSDFAEVCDTLTTLKFKRVAMNWMCLRAMNRTLRALRCLVLHLRVVDDDDDDGNNDDNEQDDDNEDVQLPSTITELTLKNIMLSAELMQDIDRRDSDGYKCAILPRKIRDVDFFRLTHLSIHHGK